MSDSDEDIPLGARKPAADSDSRPADTHAAVDAKSVAATVIAPIKVGAQAPKVSDSDSDDEPIGAKFGSKKPGKIH